MRDDTTPRNKRLATIAALGAIAWAGAVHGQEEASEGQQAEEEAGACRFVSDNEICEEIVVTGTHIRGADISGVLPVSVFNAQDIELFGVESGDELLELLPEQGQNFFNDEENISGGVNSARGDMGAFNLRNIGTGNTLVLLNGRRMVNAASYQTEEVGGSFVPVNTVNSRTLPVYGIDRVEILKDGASAIYGADAVAGVVNTVLSGDYEGARLRVRHSWYDRVERTPLTVDLAWGRTFNDGRTNVTILGSSYARGRINSQEDARWANSDQRDLIPEDSGLPDSFRNNFRRDSINSLYGQFDVLSSARSAGLRNTLTDAAGEFEIYPLGDDRCQWQLNDRVCGAIDGQGTIRYNFNADRDLSAKLSRTSLFAFVNHELASGAQSFSELMIYNANTNTRRHPSARLGAVAKFVVGKENYYNPFGPVGSPNRLPASVIPNVPAEGLDLEMDWYRFAELPRIVDNDGWVYRVLQGFRGSRGAWDWETAALFSRATREDVTRNRISNTAMTEALRDPTPAAYNPFAGGVNSNLERTLIDVRRDNEMDLFLVDVKLSNATLFDLPAGPVGFVAGAEFRREAFEDDRDPRLDGTIVFTDRRGVTFPYISDVANSSPTSDSKGDRNVTSLFGEFHVPLLRNVELQAALRFENFSDVGDTVVGKLAGGWRPFDALLLRASWSEAFRVPNLVTLNESLVARQNTRSDHTCTYASDNGGDPDERVIDCSYGMQRTAQGSAELVPETSENASIGIVIEPSDNLTLMFDYWTIEKDVTIGLLGEENHTIVDLLRRLTHGGDNCGALQGNPAVVRDPASELPAEEAAIYVAAGLCPAGRVIRINDRYRNLDTRTLEGLDAALEFEVDSDIGTVRFRYVASFLRKFEQEPGGVAGELAAAKDTGMLPADFPIRGFEDLVQRNGNQKVKRNMSLFWRNGPLGASVSNVTIGKVYQALTAGNDRHSWWLPPMSTWNATLDYYWDSDLFDTRIRLGGRNLADERAPLARGYFGFSSDIHSDYGRSFYLDLRLTRR